MPSVYIYIFNGIYIYRGKSGIGITSVLPTRKRRQRIPCERCGFLLYCELFIDKNCNQQENENAKDTSDMQSKQKVRLLKFSPVYSFWRL